MWGGCCYDFDFVGVLYGVCKNYCTPPMTPNVRNLIGSVYHWWWSRMEPGEKRLWSPSLS